MPQRFKKRFSAKKYKKKRDDRLVIQGGVQLSQTASFLAMCIIYICNKYCN